MLPKQLKLLALQLLVAIVAAQTSTSGTPPMSGSMSVSILMMSSMPIATPVTMSATGNISAAEYTITALPAVQSQPSCIFNCLIPIGLADPSGCDDVTNECACLIAPGDVLDVLTGCIQTVCQSSTNTYAVVATSLYESYCQSVFGAAEFSQAFAAESSAAAASMTMTMSSTGSVASAGSITATTTPSATAKSASVKRTPPWLALGPCVLGGHLVLSAF